MPERTNRIGRHLPTSGGLAKTLEAARDLGCEAAQIFVSNPQGLERAPIHGARRTAPTITVVVGA